MEQVTRQLSLPAFEGVVRALPAEQKHWVYRASDTLGTYARINMLMSPLTHIRNIAGTAGTTPWQFAEGLVAAPMEQLWRTQGGRAAVGAGLGGVQGGMVGETPEERLRNAGIGAVVGAGAVTGAVRGRTLTREARFAGEAQARASGMAHAFSAAGANGLDVLRHGDDALETAQTGRVAGGTGVLGKIDDVLGKGFRLLSAEDAVAKTIYEGGEIYAQAYRAARSQGLKGAAADAEMQRLIQNPTPEIVAAVEKAGKYQTYNQDPKKLTDALMAINKVPFLGTSIAPFIRTPVNAIKYDMERSPLGVASVLEGAIRGNATTGEMADKTARALLGSSLAFGLTEYARAGNITGPLPASQAERDAWQAEGKKPWHIRIGGSWQDLRLLPGLGANIAIAGALADVARRTGSGELTAVQGAARYASHLAGALGQKPLLDGLTSITEAIGSPERADKAWERIVAGWGSQYAPGASVGRWVNGMTDTVERDAQGIMERLKASYPGSAMAGSLEPKRTAFGDVISRSQTGIEAAINPIRRSAARAGIRRFDGSRSAAQDTEIQQALTAVARHDDERGPAPTARQQRLADRFDGEENERWSERRADEAQREREKAARGRR